jgi:hypothetical protein
MERNDEFLSVAYRAGRRSFLKTDDKDYGISDIYETGLRFDYNRKIIGEEMVLGEVELLCGESIAVEGMIVGEDGDYRYMAFRDPIGKSTLEREHSFVSHVPDVPFENYFPHDSWYSYVAL